MERGCDSSLGGNQSDGSVRAAAHRDEVDASLQAGGALKVPAQLQVFISTKSININKNIKHTHTH